MENVRGCERVSEIAATRRHPRSLTLPAPRRIGILAVFLFGATAHAEQYICAASNVSGFSFNPQSKTWQNSTFTADQKWIVSPPKSDEPADLAYVVRRLGSTVAWGACKEGFSSRGMLYCQTVGGQFEMNRNNGRFTSSYTFGYTNPEPAPGTGIKAKEGDDTPAISIGTCSSF